MQEIILYICEEYKTEREARDSNGARGSNRAPYRRAQICELRMKCAMRSVGTIIFFRLSLHNKVLKYYITHKLILHREDCLLLQNPDRNSAKLICI